MTQPRRVAIIGISDHWAGELARRLEREPGVEYIAGIDTAPPPVRLDRTEYIEADIRSPVLGRLLASTEVDTIVHCGILWYPQPGKPSRQLHDINVIGTLQLLAACEHTTTLGRLVVRGSAAIYGCEGAAPLMFREDMARKLPLRTRFQRDIGELENYFDNFARRRPGVSCCMLRFQPEIGADLGSPLVRYLSLPVVPTQLGFDPRLQLLHAEDATGALHAAIGSPVRGAVNVAPSGAISLSRIVRLCDRLTLPIPPPLAEPTLARLGRTFGAGEIYSDALRLLRFGRGLDNHRLRDEIGYQPRYDAVAAVEDFARKTKGRNVAPIPTPGAALGWLVRRAA